MIRSKETKDKNNSGVLKLYSLRPSHSNGTSGSNGSANNGAKGTKGGKQK